MTRPLATWSDLLAATAADPWVRLHADAWASPDGAWELETDDGHAVGWVSPDPTDLGELRPVLQTMGDPAAAAALCAEVLSGQQAVTLPSVRKMSGIVSTAISSPRLSTGAPIASATGAIEA